MPEKYSITHVIFDFDEVLVDSEQAYYEANDRFLRLYDKSYNNELKLGMMGKTKEDGAKWLLETTGLNAFVNLADYMEQFESYLDELFPKTDILPGIRRLIEHFDQHGIPMAICTSLDVEEFNKKVLNCSDLLPKMSHIVLVGSDKEIKRGKPAPDPYIAAMNRFEEIPISPKNVLVFEDSVSGARSALAAGMTTVIVPQLEYLPKTWAKIEAIFEKQVAEIIYSMEHFFPEKYGLPSLMEN